ncbi:MAG: hypothetical protein O7G85_11445 [Planctomycetota bacterium]|nr:hypothetical protein [Planctomycetota bacterium]
MPSNSNTTTTSDRWRKLRRKAEAGKLLLRHPFIGCRSCQYLFILSHMRSRSSLLSHLLGSHPDISGYTESHIPYKGRLDFLKLRLVVAMAIDGESNSRFILDKVLHNWYLKPSQIDRMGVKPIFLIRDPVESLKSLRHIMKDENDESTLQRSLNHYRKQLKWMMNCCRALTDQAIFIDSGSLVNSTQDVFDLLQEHLKLSSPLVESYNLFKYTGQTKHGDPSSMIKSGVIVRDGQKSYDRDLVIPPPMLDEARAIHEKCVRVLEARCVHLGRTT